ncbi:hypothetical protein UA08_08631 [Talaromyces atroroseus]|uniref:Zn(2)-C6 fungal-type domain-containing protein n=1 Tax=Talaromyces atroroseus TaxID=1441469 RepID=A0A225AB45_TALAT|nr:hypothetical protein UA08_08631 [Talaromyces atroroseus]OKL55963.1 hypothetical protein UA08_08631 [Talaromyces atroroseus]
MAGGDSSAPTIAPSGYMRQRSRYACAPCRQRKRKCDGTFPCSTCTGYGYECQYSGNVHPESSSSSAIAQASQQTTSTSTTGNSKRKALTAGLDEPATSPATSTSHRSRPTPPGALHVLSDEPTSHKDRGVLVPSKFRYMSKHSSVAFPQWVGKNLQSINPPRVHSFAYNTGIRRELPYSVTFDLQKYITWAEVHDSLDIYASVINPVFGFVDIDDLRQRSHDHWHERKQDSNFEALISGVIGLASLFSKLLCEGRELRIIQHAKDILDDPHTLRFPRLETISACILRTIYIRSTSRPGSAWLYSCTTMHFIEAIGIYRELEAPPEINSIMNRPPNGSKDILARVAMVARCLHIIISYEHGRSMADMGPVSEHHITKRSGDFTLQLNALVNTLPSDDDNKDSQDQAARKGELSLALRNLIATPTDHEFFSLIKGDLCFCIYRRLRLLDLGIRQEQLTQIIQAGKAALPAARILILRNHPWWNTVGTVFQYICVLLAIDSSESLAEIPEAMETLETIAKHLKTHLADEAMSTAKLLVRSMAEKKKKETAILEKTTGKIDRNYTTTSSSSTNNIAAHKPNAMQGSNGINNNSNNPHDTHDDSNSTSLMHATTPMNVVPPPPTPPLEWTTGLLDFMDPLWNWDAFFQPPPLTSSQIPPFTDASYY